MAKVTEMSVVMVTLVMDIRMAYRMLGELTVAFRSSRSTYHAAARITVEMNSTSKERAAVAQ
jgi:hypothetical protein